MVNLNLHPVVDKCSLDKSYTAEPILPQMYHTESTELTVLFVTSNWSTSTHLRSLTPSWTKSSPSTTAISSLATFVTCTM